jgi:CRISPR system Cascade subunit CasD
MLDVLLLRLDAPLMSFGGVVVDNRGVTLDFPLLSMIAGFLGNSLGYDHRDAERLSALQVRLRYAVRCDRPGQRVTDYQTVDLGQDHLVDTGWTTRGAREERGKGVATSGTSIRYREYWADAVYTVVVTLSPAEGSPDVVALERALQEPERPLFVGRKTCLPAAPMLLGRTTATSLRAALEAVPRIAPERSRDGATATLTAWLPEGEDAGSDWREIPVTDERDWENQIVVGRRLVRQTRLTLREARDER